MSIRRSIVLVVITAIYLSCSTTKLSQTTCPDTFRARFETTKGNFDIIAHRQWSPHGVCRLYDLIRSGYYEDMAIYRVIPGYVAQWGVHPDSTAGRQFVDSPIPDEPVIKSNTQGTISFARGGPESRGTMLFINLEDNNPRLDTIQFMGVEGFPVVAEITDGLEVALSFYDGYGRTLDTMMDTVMKGRNELFEKDFPKLDYIHRAYLIE